MSFPFRFSAVTEMAIFPEPESAVCMVFVLILKSEMIRPDPESLTLLIV